MSDVEREAWHEAAAEVASIAGMTPREVARIVDLHEAALKRRLFSLTTVDPKQEPNLKSSTVY